MRITRARLAVFGTIFVVTAIASYAVFQAREYIRGPEIKIEEISQNKNLSKISGTAERVAFLSLNGKQIYTDKDGKWQETILLLPGYNIVEVSAKDRFGREIKTHKDIYLNN
jgi:hypothetical protein